MNVTSGDEPYNPVLIFHSQTYTPTIFTKDILNIATYHHKVTISLEVNCCSSNVTGSYFDKIYYINIS